MVGDEILHFDGSAWSAIPANSPPASHSELMSVWGSGPEDIWAGGSLTVDLGANGGTEGNIMVHWDGSVWSGISTHTGHPSTGTPIVDLWGSGPSDVWAVTSYFHWPGATIHWDGSSWSDVASNVESTNRFGIWGRGPNDVWGVGSAPIMHWDGTEWFAITDPVMLRGVWDSAAGDLWAVGPRGVILHL